MELFLKLYYNVKASYFQKLFEILKLCVSFHLYNFSNLKFLMEFKIPSFCGVRSAIELLSLGGLIIAFV